MLDMADVTAEALDAPVLRAWAASLKATASVRRNGGGAREAAAVAKARAAGRGVDIQHLLVMAVPPATPRVRDGGVTSVGGSTRVGCLGTFELLANGRPVAWRELRPRGQLLLMYMAMRHGREAHRETLIDALWPEALLSSGVRSLQVAVSSVRQCLLAAGLPEGCIQRRGDSYLLCLPDALVQVDEIERLGRRSLELESAGALDEALQSHLQVLELYTGDLLPEVGPADWVVQERERLRGVAAGAGAHAARLALGLGSLAVAVRAAQRSIELDPYHDRPWDLLVDALERMGDHSAAAVARREHSRTCAELGI